jgi:hypothetical protein
VASQSSTIGKRLRRELTLKVAIFIQRPIDIQAAAS